MAELRRRGVDAALDLIPAPGGGVTLGAAAVGATDLLIVAGGDGTLRDVVEGLMSAEGRLPTVGLVPAGTGNDFARHMGIPTETGAAVGLALSGREQPIDVWRFNDHCFVNVAGVGLDAAVAARVNARKRSGPGGTLAYLLGFLQVFPGHRPLELRLAADGGQWSGEAWLVALGNASSYGGGMRICPQASASDGLLEVVIVGEMRRLELLLQFPRIFRGTHVRHRAVRVLRTTCLEIAPIYERESPPVTLDGELIGSLPARVERAKSRISLRCPAG